MCFPKQSTVTAYGNQDQIEGQVNWRGVFHHRPHPQLSAKREPPIHIQSPEQ